jgi:hypothetical protein
MMKKRTVIGIIAVWAVFFVSASHAGQLFTWTDEKGNLHITDTPPPESARTMDAIQYTPRPDRDLGAVQKLREHERKTQVLEDAKMRVRTTAQQAAEALKNAQDAQEAADQEQAKTQEMIRKATKRKKDVLEVDRQKEMEARTVALAEEAWRQAAAAEALAREAQDQLDLLQNALQ